MGVGEECSFAVSKGRKRKLAQYYIEMWKTADYKRGLPQTLWWEGVRQAVGDEGLCKGTWINRREQKEGFLSKAERRK